jgi:hypothetical protein
MVLLGIGGIEGEFDEGACGKRKGGGTRNVHGWDVYAD